ncbi:glutamine amidotransferase [Saccharopolyspora kobensis]|uniref:Gamma-glutamyl-hercynylcysteine sulfoxide hydrolase n=1 Tax=Saccharopolyspora kobensis TaxID=146035 RepID=A0A1H5XS20_9PSEU|nr:ergothioneine biosynthesis protein EgtC [Saccharopolyspora kobensis]SEG14227.1 glutamine amidotransferase [Saccharopolyspora kobensis]SFE39020.1 glutamine amidotransferase [Saccharopolyspora kobensis]
MCRHVGYLGPAVSLAELLLEPEHSLLEQTWAPADMRGGGTVNADGFGVGWCRADGSTARYRAAVPMWTDQSFRDAAREVRSGAVVAAVRSATVGMPVVPGACAPFTDGNRLFSHNGRVTGWPDSVAKLAARLEVVDLLTLEAATDSALLWAVLRQRVLDGADPEVAVPELVGEVVAAAPDSRLNLLFSDGARLVATTWTHSLWVHQERGAVTVASEPFGARAGWREVPDRSLVVATADDVELRPLEEMGER